MSSNGLTALFSASKEMDSTLLVGRDPKTIVVATPKKKQISVGRVERRMGPPTDGQLQRCMPREQVGQALLPGRGNDRDMGCAPLRLGDSRISAVQRRARTAPLAVCGSKLGERDGGPDSHRCADCRTQRHGRRWSHRAESSAARRGAPLRRRGYWTDDPRQHAAPIPLLARRQRVPMGDRRHRHGWDRLARRWGSAHGVFLSEGRCLLVAAHVSDVDGGGRLRDDGGCRDSGLHRCPASPGDDDRMRVGGDEVWVRGPPRLGRRQRPDSPKTGSRIGYG